MKKNGKKKCILCYFNLNSYSYIYAGLLPISCMFIHFFQTKMFEDQIELYKYNLPLLFYYFLPKLFSIIFIFIIKSKSEGESSENKEGKLLRRYHFFIRNNKRKVYFLIFIIGLLEVIFKTADSLLTYLQKNPDFKVKLLIEKRIGFIIFVPFFSYFLLNKQLYRHHTFALILALIGSSILSACRFILNFSDINDYLFHILNLLFSSFFSLALVLIKYVMVKYIIEAYNLLFYDGLFCILNTFICVLIEYQFVLLMKDVDGDESYNFHDYFVKNCSGIIYIFFGKDWQFYLYFTLTLIASFCYFVFNILTLFHFSPWLNVLTDFLTPFLLNIINYILQDNKTPQDHKRFIFENIGYIIIIFGALILNEIIIINICGLNENTYLNISYRGKLESSRVEELAQNLDIDIENDTENVNDNLTDVDSEEERFSTRSSKI